jgi:hypothetical protein
MSVPRLGPSLPQSGRSGPRHCYPAGNHRSGLSHPRFCRSLAEARKFSPEPSSLQQHTLQ